ncbi:hypothetical protein NBRC110019_20600 [Neptunitalea chrysea]|uniref:Lipocalin-like domain-containing protein n=1 Tax=Neptunitalea chrysea TaxID=1647581 RepID=A0A9W6B5N2_9FLAO|nr:hypothetical protein [Neptunitalea chrysea]GLB53020.1 hypothetical protein NBRC110019_20600 [Neptunitalea chrysea]
MKKFTILLLLSSLFVACSQKEDNNNILLSSLVGNYSWAVTSGGIANIHQTPENTGNTASLVITGTTFSVFENGQLIADYTYLLDEKNSEIFGELREFLILENAHEYIIEFNGDTLVLIDDHADCLSHGYIKE